MRAVRAVAMATMLGGLAACQQADGPSQVELGAARLPPIAANYRTQIADWAHGFYADPRSFHPTQISDPVLIRDDTGRLLWLVCIEASAHGSDGREMGLQKQAFGFAPNYMAAPLQRNSSTIIREDCERPLTWRRWTQLEPARRSVVARHHR